MPKPFWENVNDWKSIIENVFCMEDYTAEKPWYVTVSTFVVLALIGLAINLSRYNSASPIFISIVRFVLLVCTVCRKCYIKVMTFQIVHRQN